jgi:hypothetical protein
MAILRILKILSQKEKNPYLSILSEGYMEFRKFTRTAMKSNVRSNCWIISMNRKSVPGFLVVTAAPRLALPFFTS